MQEVRRGSQFPATCAGPSSTLSRGRDVQHAVDAGGEPSEKFVEDVASYRLIVCVNVCSRMLVQGFTAVEHFEVRQFLV